MAKRKKATRQQRLVQFCAILIFCAAALTGGYHCIVRPININSDPPVIARPGSDQQDPPPQQEPGTTDPAPVDPDPPPAFTNRDNCFNILVVGLDDGNGGSDTNILVQLDVGRGVIHATSLPRDTLINVNWNVKKLNSAYNVGGVDRVMTEVSRLLGIRVDRYVSVNLKGFVELVNAIGGVDFDVPIDMDYDDPVQDLHIHFRKGPRHLTGQEALGVVRFRHNNDGTGYGTEDIGRIGTQQAFLKAVAKKMLSSLTIDTIASYVDIFSKYIKTDLTTGNLVWMATQTLSIGMDNIHFHTLPGDGAGLYEGRSYYVLDPEATVALVNEAMNPYNEPLTLEDMDILY